MDGPPQTSEIGVFDRGLHRRRRERAAERFADHDFLHREVALRLKDRIEDMRRRFQSALTLGDRGLSHLIFDSPPQRLVRMDLSQKRLVRQPTLALVADEEALPFAPESFDLVVSLLTLHWVNDLPGALLQIRRALRPDGLFLAVLFGPDTLGELRRSWMNAEIALQGGASPHVSPFADTRTLGGLLQRAGFALPVVDSDRVTASYADPLGLMRDLRGMGETNALVARHKAITRRETLLETMRLYREEFANDDGRIEASFELITLTAWAPHESQPKPLRPGSAKMSLSEALKRPR